MNGAHWRYAGVATAAFSVGVAFARVMQPAAAAVTPLQAAVVDLAALQPADLPEPKAVTPNLRAMPLVTADGMTAAIQIGTIFKHVHTDANEVQIVLAGTGTEWLGDKQIPLKPGLLVIIPAGTAHGGTVDPNLKILAIKTPPQAATDIHPVP